MVIDIFTHDAARLNARKPVGGSHKMNVELPTIHVQTEVREADLRK